MNRLIYAASATCPDLRYETGFAAGDPFLWFQTEGLNAMVVSKLEYGRAAKQRRQEVQVFEYEQLRTFLNLPEETPPEKSRDDFTRMMDAIVKGTGCREWTVPEDFPYGCAKRLLDLFLKVETARPFSFIPSTGRYIASALMTDAGSRLPALPKFCVMKVVSTVESDLYPSSGIVLRISIVCGSKS